MHDIPLRVIGPAWEAVSDPELIDALLRTSGSQGIPLAAVRKLSYDQLMREFKHASKDGAATLVAGARNSEFVTTVLAKERRTAVLEAGAGNPTLGRSGRKALLSRVLGNKRASQGHKQKVCVNMCAHLSDVDEVSELLTQTAFFYYVGERDGSYPHGLRPRVVKAVFSLDEDEFAAVVAQGSATVLSACVGRHASHTERSAFLFKTRGLDLESKRRVSLALDMHSQSGELTLSKAVALAERCKNPFILGDLSHSIGGGDYVPTSRVVSAMGQEANRTLPYLVQSMSRSVVDADLLGYALDPGADRFRFSRLSGAMDTQAVDLAMDRFSEFAGRVRSSYRSEMADFSRGLGASLIAGVGVDQLPRLATLVRNTFGEAGVETLGKALGMARRDVFPGLESLARQGELSDESACHLLYGGVQAGIDASEFVALVSQAWEHAFNLSEPVGGDALNRPGWLTSLEIGDSVRLRLAAILDESQGEAPRHLSGLALLVVTEGPASQANGGLFAHLVNKHPGALLSKGTPEQIRQWMKPSHAFSSKDETIAKRLRSNGSTLELAAALVPCADNLSAVIECPLAKEAAISALAQASPSPSGFLAALSMLSSWPGSLEDWVGMAEDLV